MDTEKPSGKFLINEKYVATFELFSLSCDKLAYASSHRDKSIGQFIL